MILVGAGGVDHSLVILEWVLSYSLWLWLVLGGLCVVLA